MGCYLSSHNKPPCLRLTSQFPFLTFGGVHLPSSTDAPSSFPDFCRRPPRQDVVVSHRVAGNRAGNLRRRLWYRHLPRRIVGGIVPALERRQESDQVFYFHGAVCVFVRLIDSRAAHRGQRRIRLVVHSGDSFGLGLDVGGHHLIGAELDRQLIELAGETKRHLVVFVIHACAGIHSHVEGFVEGQKRWNGVRDRLFWRLLCRPPTGRPCRLWPCPARRT